MMEVFQKGLLTLQRLRSGGAQTIVVQRVTMTEWDTRLWVTCGPGRRSNERSNIPATSEPC